MTEASYTAWDDKQYVWPPPDGWYEASDSKWWPQGYGPPQVEEQPRTAAAVDPLPAAQEPETNEVSAETSLFEVSTSEVGADSGWQTPEIAETVVENQMEEASDVAEVGVSASVIDQAVTNVSSESSGWRTDIPAQQDAAEDVNAAATDVYERAEGHVAEATTTFDDATTTVGDDTNGFVDALPLATGAATAEAAAIGAADLTESVDEAVGDVSETVAGTSQTVLDGETFDASSAAREAFGTGLMPPMADRPAPVTENGGAPPPFDTPRTAEYRDPGAPPPQTTPDLSAFSAAPATAPPPMETVAEQQTMLAESRKSSSRGLLFAILGVLALVAIGAALFFALGGDGDSAATVR